MRFVLDLYYKLLLLAVAALSIFLLIPVGLQVLARFGKIVPHYMWTEEMSRFCLIWLIMIGSAVAVRENTHFDIDLLPKAKTRLGELCGILAVRLAIFGFGIVFLIGSLEFAEFGMILSSEITDLNLVWVYGIFPFAAIGWLIFTAEAIVTAISKYPRGQELTAPTAGD
ncbi:TRAP transporter small permease subunit [Xinfangfangia sp. CPCC 101601]|uniref:TRAP transporter small permease protein n=1 Tax=Pseudogemmobacter lacusdianii TaxID=3069608 RepID=A0ABU0VUA4_9RHOB|nr:TRAP transporter small permease subunit [Xinfangfangia sp. CPCC 101601]MDQ2064840.1 TRAP transporter small permease subunit [Xinfangfangia sp. CPCC 101601]